MHSYIYLLINLFTYKSMYLFTKISEVILSALIYRLLHDKFSSIVGTQTVYLFIKLLLFINVFVNEYRKHSLCLLCVISVCIKMKEVSAARILFA